jgi:hypothetical protein
MIKIVKSQTIKLHHYQTPEEAIRDLKRFQDTQKLLPETEGPSVEDYLPDLL